MALDITIDPSSSEPPFEQVRRGVMELVARGDLIVGTRLPTVRALADALGIAANTAARAYRELEAAGVIETRGRHGSFVAARSDSARDQAQRATTEHVAALRALGIADDEITSMLAAAVRRRP
ncbi:GntR family transcriptional regulator [Williamsia serinedens]|uniref:DNA-binding transcriptional regulator YhcF, GntR family n=1 Tax=Williamsia serinedens TaxID=391736 RepID=A0ABT1GZW3_9NOCA|nr:GntR family transcriptional regulator [Williamsia serinedens]MCP2160532.1 DNA-binding transcriptional regulator YhcF, GntR family [Williamsia serinedens]